MNLPHKKTMEKLLNGYIKIEPVSHDSFVASAKDSYEEIGTVLAVAEGVIFHWAQTFGLIPGWQKNTRSRERGKI